MSDKLEIAEAADASESTRLEDVAAPCVAEKVGNTKGAFDTEGVIRQTHVGGQALIEGVMMRGRYNWAVAVREPQGGIYVEEHDLMSGRHGWMLWPVVRGVTAFVESLGLGYKALSIAEDHAYDEEGYTYENLQKEGGAKAAKGSAASLLLTHSLTAMLSAALDVDAPEPAPEPAPAPAPAPESEPEPEPEKESEGLPKGLMTVSMVLGLVLGVVLFIVAPAALTNLIVGDYTKGTLVWNLVDGVLRVAVFLVYLALISLMPDIKRMFGYHGAEHKTIHCFEHGEELTPQNAMRFPRLHVRCGTAFLLMTMIIAIFVFTVVPVDRFIAWTGVTNGTLRLVLVILSRIVLLPVVAGLAYEVTVKWAGSHPEQAAVRVVLWPGLQLQRLTTNVPDTGMLECAIASMNAVLEREERELAHA